MTGQAKEIKVYGLSDYPPSVILDVLNHLNPGNLTKVLLNLSPEELIRIKAGMAPIFNETLSSVPEPQRTEILNKSMQGYAVGDTNSSNTNSSNTLNSIKNQSLDASILPAINASVQKVLKDGTLDIDKSNPRGPNKLVIYRSLKDDIILTNQVVNQKWLWINL